MIFTVHTLEDWQFVAQAIIQELAAGVFVLLSGPLGAGKTTLTQEIARELGIVEKVKSPTFALLRTYQVPKQIPIKKLVHIDAYRLETEEDVRSLGLEDMLLEKEAAMLIEWPEQMPEWIKKQETKKIWVTIVLKEGETREVTIKQE